MVFQRNFFSDLSAQNEVNELLPVNSLLFVAVLKNFLFPKIDLKETLFAPKFDSRLVNADWLIT